MRAQFINEEDTTRFSEKILHGFLRVNKTILEDLVFDNPRNQRIMVVVQPADVKRLPKSIEKEVGIVTDEQIKNARSKFMELIQEEIKKNEVTLFITAQEASILDLFVSNEWSDSNIALVVFTVS